MQNICKYSKAHAMQNICKYSKAYIHQLNSPAHLNVGDVRHSVGTVDCQVHCHVCIKVMPGVVDTRVWTNSVNDQNKLG